MVLGANQRLTVALLFVLILRAVSITDVLAYQQARAAQMFLYRFECR